MKKRQYHLLRPENLAGFCRSIQFIASQEKDCVILNNHSGESYQYPTPTAFDITIAWGSLETIRPDRNKFDELYQAWQQNPDWLFGGLSYDLKNELEALVSENSDSLGAPELYFFVPKFVAVVDTPHVRIYYREEHKSELLELLEKVDEQATTKRHERTPVKIQARMTKDEYLDAITQVKRHISLGDIYEANYCQEFYAENVDIDPYSLWEELTKLSPMPFSAYARFESHHVMCASPERYMRKRGSELLTQPIKGTTRRSTNPQEDQNLARSLYTSEKERSENIMIVDLVRNDLSHVAERGSVQVKELCGVYAFPYVFQMISSVTARIDNSKTWVDALKTSFPMGSMTGAPKIMAMQLMEKYEQSKRGLYSGSLGYISPEGDFDFNVVIRSMQYNTDKRYLNFMVGGAITDKSDPEAEYQETLLKAKAIFELLEA